MTQLVAINVYPERMEGEVVVWLVISRQDGQVTAMTYSIHDTELLIDALTDALAKAKAMRP